MGNKGVKPAATSTDKISNSTINQQQPDAKYQPGEGLRSLRSTTAFRVVNFELYAKPNIVIMTIGVICFGTTLCYIGYMRSKYEGMGYYAAIQEDGSEVYTKKNSRWDT